MGGAGNQRLFSVDIKSGSLEIDGLNNKIIFEMDSHYLYSDPGITVKDGNILINSQKKGNVYSVNFTRDYSGIYDITYKGENKIKTISQSATSYNLQIINRGGTAQQEIDFLIS